MSSSSLRTSTTSFKTASGKPVCRYALGGAARSVQPKSLPSSYCNHLTELKFAPFCFYYNPHRYPDFMAGIKDLCTSQEVEREDLFIASGGTDRSLKCMEQRLADALEYCGGKYLDMFVLEYICPEEIADDDIEVISHAIDQAQSWLKQGRVRYVAASTHSHVVGASLAEDKGIDALMLRFSMSHKDAAETLSFPACIKMNKPVLAFTTTRWNALQSGHEEWSTDQPPSTGDCLSFALAYSPPVEVVLHSARDENELADALKGLHDMSAEDLEKWNLYGKLNWNSDGFDEYPEERTSSVKTS